jgi:hypothetical protein
MATGQPVELRLTTGDRTETTAVSHVALRLRDEGDAQRTQDHVLWLPPGGSGRADAIPRKPGEARGLAVPGSTFEIWMNRLIGFGEIEEVFDPGAAYDYGRPFQDGDIVDLVIRGENGAIYTERTDFGGIVITRSGAAVLQYLWRYDHTTDLISLEKVVDIRLIIPREARRPTDLEQQD